MTLSQKDAHKVTRALRQPKPCLLCGAYPPTYAGLFVPDRSEAWGGQSGKGRLLVYALCAQCYALPVQRRLLAVEARIMAGLVGQRN